MAGRKNGCCICRAHNVCHSDPVGRLRKEMHGDWGPLTRTTLPPSHWNNYPGDGSWGQTHGMEGGSQI